MPSLEQQYGPVKEKLGSQGTKKTLWPGWGLTLQSGLVSHLKEPPLEGGVTLTHAKEIGKIF